MSTARSTTSTLTYTLKKYSRSYPSIGSGSSSQAPSGSEWQHFTNPVLRLSLDITKSAPSGVLEAVKLRIIWIMNAVDDPMDVDQSEVALENLDLYAFSSMANAHRMPSPPLKAVFRDSVVGIRYQHPRSGGAGSNQAFRRFQVNFQDNASATQFIDSIRAVCPCQSQDGTTSSSLARNATAIGPLSRAAAPSPGSSLSKPVTSSLSRTSTAAAFSAVTQYHNFAQEGPSSLDIRSSDTFIPSSSLNFTTSSSRPASAASMQSNQASRARQYNALSHPSDPQPESSLPPSSIPPASLMPPPPPPLTNMNSSQPPASAPELSSTYDTDSMRSSFLSALQKDRKLYDMSRAELEVLVGQILREPGFEQLVQTLGTIWDAKGFFARSSV